MCLSLVLSSMNQTDYEKAKTTGVMFVNHIHWRFPYLPDLPENLTTLYAFGLDLESVPSLPPGLKKLDLNNNKRLTSLPPLPVTLEELYINGTNIAELPPLPPNLLRLECHNTKITVLPDLPPRLQLLVCSNTNITVLPPLPASLTGLDCSMTLLTALPPLPNLHFISCGHCRLSVLPRIPAHTSVLCTPNPWNADFAQIFPDTDPPMDVYVGTYAESKVAMNAYHDVQDIKARGRDVTRLAITLTRALPCDLTNHIGSFLSGHCSTLENQGATLFAQIV